MDTYGLTTRMLLHIFHIILSNGQKHEGVSELENVRAWSDFDGYTCWLSYKDLTATLLFHGNLSVEYDNINTIKEFTARCKLITTIGQRPQL